MGLSTAKLWIDLLANWERRNGTLHCIQPQEYAELIKEIRRLALQHSPRVAQQELEGASTNEISIPTAAIDGSFTGAFTDEWVRVFGDRLYRPGH